MIRFQPSSSFGDFGKTQTDRNIALRLQPRTALNMALNTAQNTAQNTALNQGIWATMIDSEGFWLTRVSASRSRLVCPKRSVFILAKSITRSLSVRVWAM